ncbi:uncharacterized protein LOC111371127 [Olea europaea var. sylvestris]|uniref:uncharacterized protein LOC111371127 n=1 Tax=Olea europaea var. sylvestris TaxID=158386 RepID=UPI000C1D1DAA|nr:uncharacterized protein LOC111371127 [Olea europaea var. sylvestris]
MVSEQWAVRAGGMDKMAMTGARRDEDLGISETISTSAPITPNPFPVNISESTSLQITTIWLNGKNFLQWSRSALMVIRGRGRLGYVTGTTIKPDESDPTYATWDAQNSMVMAWIVNSMEEDIRESYLYYSTTKELWDALTVAFSDLENSAQLFEFRNKARNLRQGDLDVRQYYNSL